jgi:hypothetical protein
VFDDPVGYGFVVEIRTVAGQRNDGPGTWVY